MDWYAVFVQTGREYAAKKSISRVVCNSLQECVVPSRRIIERKQGKLEERLRPLFPGYVLIKTQMNTSLHQRIKNAPMVFNVLAEDSGSWSRIPENEMEPILRLMQDGEVIDYSHLSIQDSAMVVHSGPLRGMEHLIRKVNKRKGRARVSLPFDGIERTMDLGVVVLPPTQPDS